MFEKVAMIAEATGAKLALSLSDAWCVERHFDALSNFIKQHVSILFSNEDEARALTGKDYEPAAQEMAEYLDEIIITRGADGAYIHKDGMSAHVMAKPIAEVLDTTGAGDLFAAGYLYGRAKGYDAKICGEIASALSGEIICHYGARPEADLKALIRDIIAS